MRYNIKLVFDFTLDKLIFCKFNLAFLKRPILTLVPVAKRPLGLEFVVKFIFKDQINLRLTTPQQSDKFQISSVMLLRSSTNIDGICQIFQRLYIFSSSGRIQADNVDGMCRILS